MGIEEGTTLEGRREVSRVQNVTEQLSDCKLRIT